MSEGQRTAVWQRLCALIETQAGGDQTDGQLLERYAVHCEAAAFAALVRRHGPMVFGLCRRVLRDHHQAEDAFQATFLVLVRKAASLDRRRPLGNWLYTIAYHAALKTRAAGARRLQREAAVARPDGVEPRDELEATELRQLLDAELHRLPEKYRAPVVLCYLQGRTNEEAAQELGWPSGTVKGRLARARDLLRDRLIRRGLTLSYAVFAAALAEPASAAYLPLGLAERTVEAASAFADNSASAPAAAIAKGVLRAMLLTKIKTAALVLATVALVAGFGVWLLPAHAETTPIAAPVPEKPKDDDATRLPEAKGQRLALDPVKSGDVVNDKEDDRPAVTLGWIQTKETFAPTISSEFMHGRLNTTGPQAGQLTSLMVVSPKLDIGEDARLEILTRDGNIFTLVMSDWPDVGERSKSVHRKVFINVPLGTLEAGKYEFRFVYQRMAKDASKGVPWHVYQSAKFATVPFTVAKADDTEIGNAVSLKYGELREPKEKPADLGTFRQFPRPQFYSLSPTPKADVKPFLGLQVGTFDRDKWWASQPKTVGDLPKLREPEARDPVYATLLSPNLQSMEWMSLRAIEWKDKEAILDVDIWQDQGSRTANVIAAHHLVVPLQTPGKLVDGKWQTAPGEYRVRVKWNFLRADNYPTGGQPYWPQDPDKLAAKDALAALLDHSEAKFTIPPEKPKDKEPAKPPAAQGERLLLDDQAPIELGPEKRPPVTLGYIVEKGRKGTILEAFQNDMLTFEGPKSGLLTSVIAVSPVLNSGENANVVSVTRDKNVFTLHMDVWEDQSFPRGKNIIHRKAFQVSLGKLEVGEYEFRLVQRHLHMDGETKPWYKLKSESAGSVKFRVTNPEDAIKTAAVLLAEEKLSEVKDAPGLGTYRQYPEYEPKVVPSGLPADMVAPRVEAGTADFKSWQGSNPLKLENLPKLHAPEKGDPVYLTILGPSRNAGEGLTLREIEWKDKEAIVRVDLWHDSGARYGNVITTPYLVIPLHAPPGDYRIKVEWTFLLAPRYPDLGQTYAVQDPTKFGDQDPFKDFDKRSETKVTIPAIDKKAPAPPAEVGEKRVALPDLKSTRLEPDKRPAITLGLVTDKGDPLKAFANGNLQIEGPRSGNTTLVFAVSPVLNSGDDARVVALTCDKHVFTLVMDVWQDNSFDRAKNIAHRKAFQVNLGELEGGAYELRLVQRHLHMDGETKPWYKLKSVSAGTVKFYVHEPPETILTTALVLAEDQLKDVKDAKDLGSYRQSPECDTKRIASALLGGVKTPRVETGTFDRKQWKNSLPKTVDDLPKLKAPEKGDPVYLTILGPPQNSGEGLTLREIEWKDKEAIVRVDLWHDDGDRAENMIGRTHLTIPLHAPPGDYRVKVEWNFLLAPPYPQAGQTYAVQNPTTFGEKDPLKEFEKRSETKVTIK